MDYTTPLRHVVALIGLVFAFLRYERDGHYRIMSGSGFGHIGELARFLREGDKVTAMVVGSNPAYQVNLPS